MGIRGWLCLVLCVFQVVFIVIKSVLFGNVNDEKVVKVALNSVTFDFLSIPVIIITLVMGNEGKFWDVATAIIFAACVGVDAWLICSKTALVAKPVLRIVTSVVICLAVAFGVCGLCSSGGYRSYKGSSNTGSSKHSCYVCGETARYQYGSFWYCKTHYAMVKTVVEAD